MPSNRAALLCDGWPTKFERIFFFLLATRPIPRTPYVLILISCSYSNSEFRKCRFFFRFYTFILFFIQSTCMQSQPWWRCIYGPHRRLWPNECSKMAYSNSFFGICNCSTFSKNRKLPNRFLRLFCLISFQIKSIRWNEKLGNEKPSFSISIAILMYEPFYYRNVEFLPSSSSFGNSHSIGRDLPNEWKLDDSCPVML